MRQVVNDDGDDDDDDDDDDGSGGVSRFPKGLLGLNS